MTLALSPAIDAVEDGEIKPIVQPYLLVLFSVPFHVDPGGTRWIDALWAKDLLEHTRYIKQLTLATCAVHGAAPVNSVAMRDVPGLQDVRCVELPAPRSLLKALALLPWTCRTLWREVGRAKIVHSAVASWPFPEAWLLVPMLWIRRRILYLNVESAFWRLAPGEQAGLPRRIRARVVETLNRFCLERSDISTFTHDGYRRTLLRRRPQRGHVVEASWIDEANLLGGAELARVVERRRLGGRSLRVVFAGRLTHEKGVLLLLDAVAACLPGGVGLELDVFGEGPLAAECAARVGEAGLAPFVRLRGSLPYDQRFFDTLREYDVLVVPSITDEQPRIVFDAYSQGLPVIASRTEGLLQCVQEGVTGLLFEIGDVHGLQAQLTGAAAAPEALAEMAAACLARARRMTHQGMHRTRWRMLVDAFPALTKAE